MTISSAHRPLGAMAILFIWMINLSAPTTADRLDEFRNVLECDHSETESEGEENSAEWEETTMVANVHVRCSSEQWHAARGVNIELHERLDVSRLLDPPDARIGLV